MSPWYERVYLPLCKVADTPFHTQVGVVSWRISPAVSLFHSSLLLTCIGCPGYSKITELEEELKVVGNNMRSLEISEQEVTGLHETRALTSDGGEPCGNSFIAWSVIIILVQPPPPIILNSKKQDDTTFQNISFIDCFRQSRRINFL